MHSSRCDLIQDLKSKLSKLDSLDTISSLSIEFFVPPEEINNLEFEENQGFLEYISGLLSSRRQQLGKTPSAEDVKEVKDLCKKIFLSHFSNFLPSTETEANSRPEESTVQEASSMTLMYYLNVRGEGYPNQLWDAAVEAYHPHNDFMKSNLGFTIEQAVKVFKWLDQELRNKTSEYLREFGTTSEESMSIWYKWRKGEITAREMLAAAEKIDKAGLHREIELHKSRLKNIFLFEKVQLEKQFGKRLIGDFLRRFGARFGEVNKYLSKPEDFNELNITPILLLNESQIFIPIPMLLWQVPVKTLHYDIIQDSSSEAAYSRLRGEYLEEKTKELFEKIFGTSVVYRRLRYSTNGKKKGRSENPEVDLLIKFDNKILIVECKSKALTLPARQGSLEEIQDDFSNAIQHAYDQLKRTRNHILKNVETKFVLGDGKELVLRREDLNGIFSVCVTAETFTHLATNLSFFLQKDEKDPFPWVVSLHNLELVAEYLPDPYLFIHFLIRRLILHGIVFSHDEMDYVGCYLKEGLYFSDEMMKKYNRIFLSGFTDQFDRDQLKKMGLLKMAKVGSSWSNPAFENLLGSIKEFGLYGHSDIIFSLLELNAESRDNLIRCIREVIEKTKQDKKIHDFTIPGKNLGFSFVATIGRIDLRDRVLTEVFLKKYKYKCPKWVGMGRDVLDTRYLVNECVYFERDWEYDKEMDERVRRYLTLGMKKKL